MMFFRSHRAVAAIIAALLLLVGIYFAYQKNRIGDSSQVTETTVPASRAVPSDVSAPESTQSQDESAVYYPMTNYLTRITNRGHGKQTTLADSEGFACGGQFEGIHVGDDLEVTASELNVQVPIYAISAGTVSQASIVGGYGGLLITQNTVAGETVNAYYGHVAVGSLKVKSGQEFTAGQLLGYLGESCTTDTSDERKHLHFAIRKGTSIDVRGYLESSGELSEWHNPAEFLKGHSAAEPK